MEKYLEEEYNVFEDEKWLKSETKIEEYFKDNGRDWLDCGQGYAQDEAEIICKIDNKFYKVVIHAEIESSKQDYGDRLYWVDYISSVEYWEVEKPLPKEKVKVVYDLELTQDQKEMLENFMKNNNIGF